MIIDSHHHFWTYDPVTYDWIDDSMATLRRDFLPDDLRATLGEAGVGRAVSVQARQSLEETRWLCELAQASPDLIAGVVGWVDLSAADVGEQIAAVSSPSLVGLRHVLQGEPDERYMLRDDFQRGLRAVREAGLVYDILIYERHLPQTIELVDAHPEQAFVLDHIAKPRIGANELEPWRQNIRSLAERPNVVCKLSGLVTEAGFQAWTEDQLRPYLETVLETFGPARLMFGSDWPVCLVATEYSRWLEIVRRAIGDLSHSEQAAVLGQNAARVYRLA